MRGVMPFEFKKLDLAGVVLIKPKVFGDSRGYFMEAYQKSVFQKNGIDADFCQDNHSMSTKGVLRGLHYQKNPKSQAKLVRCIKGSILDVAVDLRKNSPTFGKWIGEILSDENRNMLYIPSGFAHGFLVLSDKAELLYKATNEYSPEHDRGIRWNDPDINVDWKIDYIPIISDKDAKQPFFKEVSKEDLF